jgi:hypothetical protein
LTKVDTGNLKHELLNQLWSILAVNVLILTPYSLSVAPLLPAISLCCDALFHVFGHVKVYVCDCGTACIVGSTTEFANLEMDIISCEI